MPRLAMPMPFVALSVAVLFACVQAVHADMARFVGSYQGSAEVIAADGSKIPRDMSVKIQETRAAFEVTWTSVTYRPDGRAKEKSYTVAFVPTDRPGVFAAAQQKNVFGHAVQLDPMKGEPYVWAQLSGDTLSVYSLFVSEIGGYTLQQYDRTVSDGGLQLRFQNIQNGEIARAVETFLARVD
ncbi:MAG: hypothetical protein AAF601_11170 [Pseudomonadota bacterium]